MSSINFNLPDFLYARKIYEAVIEFYKNYPKVFHENTRIASIFGNLSGNIWNGGSTYFGRKQLDMREVGELVDYYNSNGIALRLTCTNPMLEHTDIYDRYANAVMKAFHNGFNEVVVTSPILEEYLRDKYPNFKYIKSIIGTYEEGQDLFLDDKYYMTCLKRIRNNNFAYLDSIPVEKRHKVEILCNDPCPEVCPRLKTHYRQMGKMQLYFDPVDSIGCSFYPLRDVLPITHKDSLGTTVSYDNIIDNYVPRGYTNFKLSGRFNQPVIVINVLKWLTKKEYEYDVLDGILHKILEYRV